MEKKSIPVIDMQNFTGKYDEVLREACKEWGCFRLVNHSMPILLTSEFKAVVTLIDDDVAALGVMNNKSGEFVAVDPLPGSTVVLLGDFGTAWSNGKFSNATQRVLCRDPSPRASINTFLMGPREGAVEAPAELCGRSASIPVYMCLSPGSTTTGLFNTLRKIHGSQHLPMYLFILLVS